MKRFVDIKKCSAIIIALIAPFSAHADISIAGFLQDLTTRTEEMATATALQSTDLYVVEEYMNVMLVQNPELREIAKFRADGTLLKAAVAGAASDRSAAKESWFAKVSSAKAPYSGIVWDKQGTPLLLRAWPVLDTRADKKLLGITIVKIDIRKFIQSVSGTNSAPLEVLCNGTPVFRRNWNGVRIILEDSFTFSGSDNFVIRYTEPQQPMPKAAPAAESVPAAQPFIPPAPTPAITEPAPAAPLQRQTIDQPIAEPARPPEPPLADEAVPSLTTQALPETTATEAPVRKDVAKSAAARKAVTTAESLNATTFQSWLSTDSILTAGYVGSSNKQIILVVLIIAGLGFVVVFIITTIMVRRARRRRKDEKERDAIFKPDPVPAIVADKETQLMDKEETRLTDKEDTRLLEKIPAIRPGYSGEQLDETSHAERETRELPAIREFIDDFLKKIHEVSHESNIKERNRVFEEINDDLNLWARSEIKQLSGRLGLLLQAIRECESKDGNSAELQVLRYEVMRIIKEIDEVEERLPHRNSVLIVN